MSNDYQNKINLLLELGKHDSKTKLPEEINLDALRNEGYRHLSDDWPYWPEFLRKSKTEELLTCMRGIVTLERLLDAQGGSTTVLPNFFKEIERRGRREPEQTQAKILSIFNWVLANSENDYLPFGSCHRWHGEYEAYLGWLNARNKHNTDILHQNYIAGLKRRTEKREQNLLRQEKYREQSRAYRERIKPLSPEQFCSEIETKKKPPEFFFPDISDRMKKDEFTQGQLVRILELIQARSSNGKNNTALRMMACIQSRIDKMEV